MIARMTEAEIFDIIFLRHGESVGNAERRWQGQAEFPLTGNGLEQTRALANRWASENRSFDTILSSPQKRALETANIIADRLKLPVEADEIWMERDIGEFAGLTGEEVKKRFPNRNNTTPFAPIIGAEGEGNWELYLRAGRALQSLITCQPGKYLVVSHGGLLNQVMHAVVGITPQAGFSGLRFRFQNTGFAHLIYRTGSHEWHIHAINDCSHWNGKVLI